MPANLGLACFGLIYLTSFSIITLNNLQLTRPVLTSYFEVFPKFPRLLSSYKFPRLLSSASLLAGLPHLYAAHLPLVTFPPSHDVPRSWPMLHCWRQQVHRSWPMLQYVDVSGFSFQGRYRALLISYSQIRNLILLPCDLVWRQRVSADQLLWSISATVMWLSCVTVSTSCDHVGGSREDQFQQTSCDCLASQFPRHVTMWDDHVMGMWGSREVLMGSMGGVPARASSLLLHTPLLLKITSRD